MGPFDVLAGLKGINPLAPKLMFAYAYILFCVWQFKGFALRHRFTAIRTFPLTVLFWNLFPWIEIAINGTFRYSGRNCCVWGQSCPRAVSSVFRSATCLALGVLLKFFPAPLPTFLSLERGATSLAVPHGRLGHDCYGDGLERLPVG